MRPSIIGYDLIVGARASELSQAQIGEVERALNVQFKRLLMDTSGDKDQGSSLRKMGKSDFFTKEVDEALLSGACRAAIHSAKDLPEEVAKGAQIVALTQGVCPLDALVMRPGASLETLSSGALIATSSERREQEVKKLRSDFCFCDLRGSIPRRLAQLEEGIDGVVVAEAALIRLGLTHLNRQILPGATAPFQGQLAILAREGDREMADFFAPLDTRWHLLWTGLHPPKDCLEKKVTHLPLIKIEPFPFSNWDIREAFEQFENYTDLILTSQTAVDLLEQALAYFSIPAASLRAKQVFAVGQATAQRALEVGCSQITVARNECSEGVIEEIAKHPFSGRFLFWPHSAQSRSTINEWLTKEKIAWKECLLYDTISRAPTEEINLEKVDEIVFTSPSTVQAFICFFGPLPVDKKLTAIGPVTAQLFTFYS